MKSGELANACLEVYLDAQRRILSVGHASYATGPGEFTPAGHSTKIVVGEERQRFEDDTLEDHLTGLEEELLDAINWAAMAVLKLREARAHATS